MPNSRRQYLKAFYSLLDRLEQAEGGARTLAGCSGRMDWPARGIYFFREAGNIAAIRARARELSGLGHTP